MPSLAGGAVFSRGAIPAGGAVLRQRMTASRGWQRTAPPPLPYGQQAGAMHPTGMLSCYLINNAAQRNSQIRTL